MPESLTQMKNLLYEYDKLQMWRGNQLVPTLGLVGHKSVILYFFKKLKNIITHEILFNYKPRPCELVDHVS